MKKLLALALALLMSVSAAGCMSRNVSDTEKNDIAYGKVENGVYESTHFGLGYKFDPNWNTDTQKQIWERNEWNSEKDLREQMMKSLGKQHYFWEMHTETVEQDVTLDVSVDNVSVIADPDISEKEYAKYCAEQAMDHFEQVKVSGAELELIESNVAGKHCHGYLVTFENEGEMCYFKVVYIRKGIYAAVIKATCMGEDVTDALLENFYQV